MSLGLLEFLSAYAALSRILLHRSVPNHFEFRRQI